MSDRVVVAYKILQTTPANGWVMDIDGRFIGIVAFWPEEEALVVAKATGRTEAHLIKTTINTEFLRKWFPRHKRTALRHKLGAFLPGEYLLALEHEVSKAIQAGFSG